MRAVLHIFETPEPGTLLMMTAEVTIYQYFLLPTAPEASQVARATCLHCVTFHPWFKEKCWL